MAYTYLYRGPLFLKKSLPSLTSTYGPDAWRANMDVQVVDSVYDAALYVTHYICKDESQALKQAIAEQLANRMQN